MDLSKHLDFLAPASYNKSIHIIGVGAIGSRIAEQLARLGFTNLVIYDFDTVDEYNITNQLYTHSDIGKLKTDALTTHLKEINPDIKVQAFSKYVDQALSGTVFLCVDSIEVRREITNNHFYNPHIDVMFDCRMRLTDAQAYGVDWKNKVHKKNFLNTMNFTDEQADKDTPVSACGTTLSVVPTVVTVVSLTIANFINYIKHEPIRNSIFVDPFNYDLMAFIQK